jgi:hypothetical protein
MLSTGLAAALHRWIITRMDDMERLEEIVARLPEAVRVDIAAWDDEPG